jgi:hypothetical protein
MGIFLELISPEFNRTPIALRWATRAKRMNEIVRAGAVSQPVGPEQRPDAVTGNFINDLDVVQSAIQVFALLSRHARRVVCSSQRDSALGSNPKGLG